MAPGRRRVLAVALEAKVLPTCVRSGGTVSCHEVLAWVLSYRHTLYLFHPHI